MNSLADRIASVEPGEIVQVRPAYARESFGGMFVVVADVAPYGIYGYVIDWGARVTGRINVSVPFEQFERTGGRVIWEPREDPNADWSLQAEEAKG